MTLFSALPVPLIAGRAGERQVLHVRTQRVADAALHRVGAFVQVLDHHVAGIVHHIGVVAQLRRVSVVPRRRQLLPCCQ